VEAAKTIARLSVKVEKLELDLLAANFGGDRRYAIKLRRLEHFANRVANADSFTAVERIIKQDLKWIPGVGRIENEDTLEGE